MGKLTYRFSDLCIFRFIKDILFNFFGRSNLDNLNILILNSFNFKTWGSSSLYLICWVIIRNSIVYLLFVLKLSKNVRDNWWISFLGSDSVPFGMWSNKLRIMNSSSYNILDWRLKYLFIFNHLNIVFFLSNILIVPRFFVLHFFLFLNFILLLLLYLYRCLCFFLIEIFLHFFVLI